MTATTVDAIIIDVRFYKLVRILCCGRYEDVSEDVANRTCPICDATFSTSEPEELFISHVEDHVVKICPVCTKEFQPDDNEAFIIHVNVCLNSNEREQQRQQQQLPLLDSLPGSGQFV